MLTLLRSSSLWVQKSPESRSNTVGKNAENIFKLLHKLGVDIDSVRDSIDLNLFSQAITHKSFVEEKLGLHDSILELHYDRLEFLGGAILKAVINGQIFRQFADYNSGQLSKLSAYLLSDKVLAQIAIERQIDQFVLCTRKVQLAAVLGDVMESLFGAFYLNFGYDRAEKLILSLYTDIVSEANANDLKDNYKAALQEYTQSKQLGLPVYQLLSQAGPPHDPYFEIAVTIQGEIHGSGSGRSKKIAEQNAAQEALQKLNIKS